MDPKSTEMIGEHGHLAHGLTVCLNHSGENAARAPDPTSQVGVDRSNLVTADVAGRVAVAGLAVVVARGPVSSFSFLYHSDNQRNRWNAEPDAARVQWRGWMTIFRDSASAQTAWRMTG